MTVYVRSHSTAMDEHVRNILQPRLECAFCQVIVVCEAWISQFCCVSGLEMNPYQDKGLVALPGVC
jgi:hypothetical protein